jgi:Dyp-type peroxidase family
MEPTFDVDEIQGHIFPGFGTDHSVVIALRCISYEDARTALASLLPDVCTMASSLCLKGLRRDAAAADLPRPAQNSASLSISIGATALRAWGIDTSGFDLSYHAGMRSDAVSLGDPIGPDLRPLDWTLDTDNEDRVDVLLIGGHSERELLEQAVEHWLSMLAPHVAPVLIEYGHRREGDKEFFGFKDGVSQPAMRGVTPEGEFASRRVINEDDPRSTVYARPGQLLIWPGSFLFGYPRQPSANQTQPGDDVQPIVPWMQNGSYLVFRRLLQNVRAFREAVNDMEDFLAQQGEHVQEGWVAAHLVGRWPDGTPLSVSPNSANKEISDDQNQINNFRFLSSLSPTSIVEAEGLNKNVPAVPADPLGMACPRASHIRQVNPRDGISEIGQEHHPGKLMLRRGIAFGPEEEVSPDADRGLLFLSYQTSIVEQFKFVQASWANSSKRPTGDGRDPIIGQDGTLNTQRRIQLFAPSGRQRRCPVNGRWVVATGGGYFFTPSISGLRYLFDVNAVASN